MKSLFKISLLAVTIGLAVGCQEQTKKEEVKAQPAQAQTQVQAASPAVTALTTDDQKAAYAIGVSLAQYLQANIEQQQAIGLALDQAYVLQGVQDAFANKALLNEEEAQAALQGLDQRVAEMAQKKSDENAVKAKQQGDAYRADFAKKEGVQTTSSGLMYKVDKLGDGKKPAAEDTIVVHYKGTLTDGTQFDSSYDRNQPATFPLNRVIPGWTEGVQLMPVGSKFTFVIPPELAYGSQDTPAIPANSTLVFDVELLDIKPSEAVASAPADASKAPAQAKAAATTTAK